MHRLVLPLLFVAGLATESAGLHPCPHDDVGGGTRRSHAPVGGHAGHSAPQGSEVPDNTGETPCCHVAQCQCAFPPALRGAYLPHPLLPIDSDDGNSAAAGACSFRVRPAFLQPPVNAPPRT